jgi:hypothetical protein
MGYFYGLILICTIIFDLFKRHSFSARALVSALAPAAVVGITLSSVLMLCFGGLAFERTIFPIAGARAYAIYHFGFFGRGALFWRPKNSGFGYYLESVAGFWLLGTAYLLAGSCYAVVHYIQGLEIDETNPAAEIVLCCALLHLVAILVLWGNEFSYVYYCYVLVLGLLAASRFGPLWRAGVMMLVLLIPFGKIGLKMIRELTPEETSYRTTQQSVGRQHNVDSGVPVVTHTYSLWSSYRPDPVTAGLWASRPEREEWSKVLAIVRGHHTALLMTDGCADLLFPEFEKPVGLHLDMGLPLQRELSAKAEQIRNSSMIVIPSGELPLLQMWPNIGRVVSANFKPIFQGECFTIFGKGSKGATT